MSYVADGYALDGYFGQPGSLACFTLGAQSLNFDRAPLRPQRELEQLQARLVTAGGVPFAFDPIAEEDVLLLRFVGMYTYHVDRLVDWFETIAEGMANTFTYCDQFGVEHTVSFAEASLGEVVEKAFERYDVTLRLLVEA